MNVSCQRVLIVDDESALLFALSEYLTFRGCRVDGAEGIADARALVQHLHYDAIVVGVSPVNVHDACALAFESRLRLPMARLVALAVECSEGGPNAGALPGFDQVLERHLPTARLARVLCHSIAA